MHRFFLLLFLFLTSCSHSSNSLVNIKYKKNNIISESKGFFISHDLVLTTYHGLDDFFDLENFEVVKIDTKKDLVLLNSKYKSKDFFNLSSPVIGDISKNCFNNIFYGDVKSESNIFINESSKILNLNSIKGSFSKGDSGMPICNKNGYVIGMLVAFDNNFGYFLSSDNIIIFLEH